MYRVSTTAEITEIYSNSNGNVSVINELAALSSLTNQQKQSIKRNVEDIETIKTYKKEDGVTSIWTTEDFTAHDAAVTLGKTKY